VSGSTAQRLGQDSPALTGQTLTLDALVSRVEHGQPAVDQHTTINFDEAGMADTDRLDRLTQVVEHTGSKLVAIGDAAQLPSIGAGGMFARLSDIAPSAELSNIRRTLDPDEQRAWADLRAGRSDRAMAHYHARGQLHMTDTRDEAVEQAAQNWATLTKTHDPSEVALISDASNQEINRLNARAQHFRALRGELGDLEVPVPGVHYGIRQGDRMALIDQHHEHGVERIENGSRGEVLDITPAGEVLIEFDVTRRRRTITGDDLARVRLGYAQHIHRAQGATVTRTLVVTGGWQTSKEPAYVEASRARQGTNWFVSREDLGIEGHDTDRIQRLAENMRRSHAQNTITRAPRTGRPRLRHELSPLDRTQPHQPNTGDRPHHQPDRQPTNTGANTMSQRIQVVLSGPVALQLRELAAAADTPPSTLAAQIVRNGVALAAKDGKVRPLHSSPVLVGGNNSERAPRLKPAGSRAGKEETHLEPAILYQPLPERATSEGTSEEYASDHQNESGGQETHVEPAILVQSLVAEAGEGTTKQPGSIPLCGVSSVGDCARDAGGHAGSCHRGQKECKKAKAKHNTVPEGNVCVGAGTAAAVIGQFVPAVAGAIAGTGLAAGC
jgi:AAA domain